MEDEEDDDDMDFVEVQVFRFETAKGGWVDEGSGHLSIKECGSIPTLSVITDECVPIVSEPITSDLNYGMQGESGITFWSKTDNIAKALSFEEQSQCRKFSTMLFNASQSSIDPPPEDISIAEVPVIVKIINSMPCSSVVASWSLNGNLLSKLFSLFRLLVEHDPTLTTRSVHNGITEVHDTVITIARSTDSNLLNKLTGDLHLWLHFLMLLDYNAAAPSIVPRLRDKPDDLAAIRVTDISNIRTPAPPWAPGVIPACYSGSFSENESGPGKFKTIRDFETPEVASLVLQNVRMAYWLSEIILPDNASSVPIPSAQPFAVSGGGAWEGTVLSLRELIRSNQITIVELVTKDEKFMASLFSRKTPPQNQLAFLTELFQLAEPAFATNGLDICALLAPHGLFPALYECLSEDDDVASMGANLLEAAVGCSPHPCTDGATFKVNLVTGGESSIAEVQKHKNNTLVVKLADLCFDGEEKTAEHALEVINKVLQGSPKKATDEVQTLSTLDLEAANMTIDSALPIFYDRIRTTEQETCYKVLAMLGHLLEKDPSDAPEHEREWRSTIRKQIIASLIRSNALTPIGCVPHAMKRFKDCPYIIGAAVRIHRCILQTDEQEYIEYYTRQDILSPVFAQLERTGQRCMVLSAVFGVLELLKGMPQLLQSSYKRHSRTAFNKARVQQYPILKDLVALLPKGMEEAACELDLDEISKAYTALMELEEIKVQLVTHYKALCQSANIEPQVPSLSSFSTQVFTPQQYSEIYGKIYALRKAAASPERSNSANSSVHGSRRDSLGLLADESGEHPKKGKVHRRYYATVTTTTGHPSMRCSTPHTRHARGQAIPSEQRAVPFEPASFSKGAAFRQ